MSTEEALIEEIVDRYSGDAGMLIPMMQDLQAENGYLAAEQLRRLSRRLELPLSRLYSVATFYASFRLTPKGRHEITLCMGTVCFLKGADKISTAICEEFRVEPGGTTADRLFTLQHVNCVGACALAPVMIVDGTYHDAMTADKALKVIQGLPQGDGEQPDAPAAAGGGPASPRGKASASRKKVSGNGREEAEQ